MVTPVEMACDHQSAGYGATPKSDSSSVSSPPGLASAQAQVAQLECPEGGVMIDSDLTAVSMRRRPRMHEQPELEIDCPTEVSPSLFELAPQLKRLRLSEDPAWRPGLGEDETDQMAVDCVASIAVRSMPSTPPKRQALASPYSPPSPVRSPFGADGSFTAATRAATMIVEARRTRASPSLSPSPAPMSPQQDRSSSSSRGTDPAAQAAWRAEVQRRALEEMRRYRQSLRNCEGGLSIRPCTEF
eukprot:TRINITY_DN36952_c0_g1_i1.p1 TRINITY_DN36952_c0_g1~~TRINITY_DN36952_c0_g1_i1.p1  ORF type:complete len:275 (-),score=26.08 TRINITY_DN36952_c0_g1_i1:110-841(-)